jgi:hypothetical protein
MLNSIILILWDTDTHNVKNVHLAGVRNLVHPWRREIGVGASANRGCKPQLRRGVGQRQHRRHAFGAD